MGKDRGRAIARPEHRSQRPRRLLREWRADGGGRTYHEFLTHSNGRILRGRQVAPRRDGFPPRHRHLRGAQFREGNGGWWQREATGHRPDLPRGGVRPCCAHFPRLQLLRHEAHAGLGHRDRQRPRGRGGQLVCRRQHRALRRRPLFPLRQFACPCCGTGSHCSTCRP